MKYLVIFTGIFTVILGFWAMFIPFHTFLALGWILGALMLINGVEAVAGSLTKKKDGVQCILGIIVAIGGCVILFNAVQRLLTDVFLAYFIGAMVIVYGLYSVFAGIKNMRFSRGAGTAFITIGVCSVIIGLISVTHPIITMISVGFIVGLNIAMQGFNMIVLGFAMGKIGRQTKSMF